VAVSVSEHEQGPIHDCCIWTKVGAIAKMMGQMQSVCTHSWNLAVALGGPTQGECMVVGQAG